MSLFTEDDEKEVAEQVAQNASDNDSLDELVERALDKCDNKMGPETARRLLRARLPEEKL